MVPTPARIIRTPNNPFITPTKIKISKILENGENEENYVLESAFQIDNTPNNFKMSWTCLENYSCTDLSQVRKEDAVERDAGSLDGGSDWMTRASDKESQIIGWLDVNYRPPKKKKMNNNYKL